MTPMTYHGDRVHGLADREQNDVMLLGVAPTGKRKAVSVFGSFKGML